MSTPFKSEQVIFHEALVDNAKKKLLEAIESGDTESQRIADKNWKAWQGELRRVEDAETIARGFQPLTAAEREVNSILSYSPVSQIKEKPLGTSRQSQPNLAQGNTPQPGYFHTPTAAEIVANGQKRDPTQPYFDTNSDHMGQIDPLAPRYDLSGDFPKPINPLKSGPKMPTNG